MPARVMGICSFTDEPLSQRHRDQFYMLSNPGIEDLLGRRRSFTQLFL